MSKEGIRIMADVFAYMQNARLQLIGLATHARPLDKTDLALAQLCDDAKDAIKDQFCQVTSGKFE